MLPRIAALRSSTAAPICESPQPLQPVRQMTWGRPGIGPTRGSPSQVKAAIQVDRPDAEGEAVVPRCFLQKASWAELDHFHPLFVNSKLRARGEDQTKAARLQTTCMLVSCDVPTASTENARHVMLGMFLLCGSCACNLSCDTRLFASKYTRQGNMDPHVPDMRLTCI